MKKVLALLLVVLMCLPIISTTVAAVETPTLTLSSTTGNRGDEVELTIGLENNPGFTYLKVRLQYDANVVAISVKPKANSVGTLTPSKELTTNPYVLTFNAGSENYSDSGELCKIKIKILDAAAFGETTLNLTFDQANDEDYNKLTFTSASAKITVNCPHANTKNTDAVPATCISTGFTAGVYCNDCGKYISGHEEVAIDPNNHTNTENTAAVAATCQSVGYTAGVYCNDCKKYVSGHEEIAKTDHTYDDTWTSDGEKTHSRKCKVCGSEESKETENHTWDNGTITKEPSHTLTGVKTYTCTKCGQTKTETLPTTTEHGYNNWTKVDDKQHKGTCECGDVKYEDHTWNAGVVTKAATCSSKGEKTYTCTKCGATKTEETPIDSNNHVNTEDTAAVAATCTSVGYTKGVYCNDCQKYISGHEEIAKLAHTYGDTWTNDGESGHSKVCTVCGTAESKITEKHTYTNYTKVDDNTHVGTCVCGATHTENHAWDEGTVTTAATHLTEGVKTYTCTVCGATKTETIAKTTEHTFGEWTKLDDKQHSRTCECGEVEKADHTWNNGVVTTAATHLQEGVKTYTCTACGATKTESIAKTTEHTFTNWTKISDTQHQGTCECGETHTENHTWNSGVVTTAATHLKEGVKTYTCTKCGATKTESIAKITTHTFGEWTKLDDKQHSRTCECGEVEKADHTWNSGVVTTAATHLTEGVMTYTCTACGATKTESIAKTTEHTFGKWTKLDDNQHSRTCACGEIEKADHTWNSGVITTAATHLQEGVKTYTCTVCGATKTESIAKTTEHTFGRWVNLNSNQHARTCACGETQKENHKWVLSKIVEPATCASEGKALYICSVCGTSNYVRLNQLTTHTYDNDCDPDCNVCGATREVSHKPETVWSSDATSHWHVCSVCNEKLDVAAHTPGPEATNTTPQVCTVCGYVITPAIGHTHNFSSDWSSDNTNHWHACSGCSEVIDLAPHRWDSGTVTAKPTETLTGTMTYKCAVCGKTRTEEIPKLPTITTPEKTEWEPSSEDDGMSFRSTADIKDFVSVEVDGKVVDKSNYDVIEGSTIVILHPDFLKTLGNGVHDIAINSTTGTAKTSFTVKNNDSVPPYVNPNIDEPGDPEEQSDIKNVFVIYIVAVAVVAVIAIVVILIIQSKKSKAKKEDNENLDK